MSIQLDAQMYSFIAGVVWLRVVTPSATARLHTTATHAVPSTTETPEHHFAAVANTITPEDGRIRPKHVELYNTCNKVIHLCIKLDTNLPYDYDARSHNPQMSH
jgi:hypothetical protein